MKMANPGTPPAPRAPASEPPARTGKTSRTIRGSNLFDQIKNKLR
jgi:hypothetical protein